MREATAPLIGSRKKAGKSLGPSIVVRAGDRVRRWQYLVDVIVVAGIIAETVLLASVLKNPDSFLYLFFVPVAGGAVLVGRLRGATYALLAILGVLVCVAIGGGPNWLYADKAAAEQAGTLLLWAACLVLTAYVVGMISERGGNRAFLQGVGSEAITAVERERSRMSCDIHDGLAQAVTMAQMEVEILEALTVSSSPEIRAEVQHLRETVGAGGQEIRDMIGNLRPPPLNPDEFVRTLERLIADFREHVHVKIELDLEGDLQQHSNSMRICVYRIVQEALSNIEQHAQASRVRVGIRATKSVVFLTVTDDGVGFDTKSIREGGPDGHFGVLGMHERAALLQGRVRIASAPGEGTVVRAHIPGPRR